MNIVKTVLASVVVTHSLSAIAAALTTNSAPPYFANEMNAFDARMQKNEERRQRFINELIKMGDSAAEVGIAYSQDEWVELHNSLLWLGSYSLSMEFLETLRRTQNVKAQQVAERKK